MEKKIIEINGVKLEVDTRNVTRIEHIHIGARVKVLKKEYSNWKVHHGVVIGFEPFKNLPTIIVAVALVEYSTAKLEFVYYNSDSEEVEIVIANEDDKEALDKSAFVSQVNREIDKKQNEIKELVDRREYFLSRFGTYWNPLEENPNVTTVTNSEE